MEYYASGKLLLFGEYLVLKHSRSLAIPLRYGQKMKVIPREEKEICWKACMDKKEWFSAVFSSEGTLKKTTNEEMAFTLQAIFESIREKRPELFNSGYFFELNLNFDPRWGFGTSSTLISLLAQWSHIDSFYLLEKSFGGSGYDIICATAHGPVIFEGKDKKAQPVHLSPAITSKLLFVYSGKKQKSQPEVKGFATLTLPDEAINTMNDIVSRAVSAIYPEEVEVLIQQSETFLAKILGKEPLKKTTFPDYLYGIKSLGAWGGDFFMATFREENEARNYFKSKGYEVMFNYEEIIKK